MAELTRAGERLASGQGPAGKGRSGVPGRARVAVGVRAYWMISAMWVRSALAYPASFVLMALAAFAVTGLDFVVILLMFSRVDALGGYGLGEIAFLYGISSTAFGLCDLLLGSMRRLGERVRDGTFDTLLVRPAPALVQIAADQFSLNRLGRIAQGLFVLGYGLFAVDVQWSVVKVAAVPFMVLSGAGIFAAVYVAGAAFQFLALDGAEVENAFTYGGQTMLQYPPTLFTTDVLRAVTFVLPLSFVNWVPAAHVLGRPLPLGLPGWCALLPPVVAVVCLSLAALAWRAGLRSYRSTGS